MSEQSDDPSSGGGERARRKPRRGLPDLGALFDEVDNQAAAQPKPPAQEEGFLGLAFPARKAAPAPAEPSVAPAEEKPAQEPTALDLGPRPARRRPDLGALFGEPASPAAPESAPGEQKPVDVSPEAGPRPARKRPDLGALFGEPASPAAPESAPGEQKPVDVSPEAGPRPARKRPDLGALFGEPASPAALEESKPAERPAESKSRPRDRAAVLSLFGKATERTESPEAPARSRKLDLSASRLFDEDSEEQSAGRSEEQLVFPAELQSYLSPDLWRKLNSPALARGALFNALERVRSILYLVSTFMPAYLVQEKMRRPVAGLVSGQMLRGSLLFSDVSGFTPLSERLAVLGPEGAERVTAIMNQYFATMLEIISWSGGVLLKFAGDAMLVYFPEQENGAHAGWAVRAGQRMLRAMKNFAQLETPKGTVTLQMKVGLATGEFLAASVGSEKRMEYFVVGPAVTRTMAAEGKTTGGGQLVVNEATLQAFTEAQVLKSLPDGFALLQPGAEQAIDDFEIKAETRRARGAVPWNASPRAILAQIEVALRQIQALIPYLAPELVERIVAHARRRQVESEYRPTTVMFCNFTGPEVLLDTWGAVGVQRITSILNAYFSSMQEVIARYGGIISRVDPYSKGTKMLVLFGAPVAHEDDPQRAVSAALAMNAELEALEEGWRRKFARYLPPEGAAPLVQHRMGITFGQTFAGQVGSNTRREYTVMGDEVNLAARLMSAAEMGQILIEQQVQKAVADYFVLNALPPMRVKGKSKPISVFQVAGPRDDTLASRARSRSSLVGRDMELAQAAGLLEQALQGRGGLLILAGPAGIGKSHLADELVNRATRQGGAHAVHTLPLVQRRYAVFSVQRLDALAGRDYFHRLSPARALRQAANLAQEDRSAGKLAAHPGGLDGTEPR